MVSNELVNLNYDSNQDIIAGLIADKHSAATKREYEKDLRNFFYTIYNQDLNQTLVSSFLALDQIQANLIVFKYNPQEQILNILGKGRGTQKQAIDLSGFFRL
jgi:hypothetical protein